MSETMEPGEQSRNPRPRWKNYPEAIHFILKRTIPEHPIPRGKYRLLFPQVANEVNERFDFGDRKADAKGIKYVTEKYGSDPVFGNRKMQVIHPAKGKSSTREKKTLMRARRAVENGGGNLILCPHCEGNGFVEADEVDEEDDESQESQGVASGPPSPVGYGAMHPGQTNTVVSGNLHHILQPPTGNAGNTHIPSHTAHLPSAYHGPLQPGQVFEPISQYPTQVLGPPVMGNNNAYNNMQGIIEPIQASRDTGVWDGARNTIDQNSHAGQTFSSGLGENPQTAPIPPFTVPHQWQNNMSTNTGAMNPANYGRISREGNTSQTNESIHIDPALRTGAMNELLPMNGGSATQAPGFRQRPRSSNQVQQTRPNDFEINTGLYGNSLAGGQVTASAQPGIVADNQLTGVPPASSANASYFPGDFSVGNAGYDFAIDPALLNQTSTEPNNNLGDNQDFHIDGDFSFVDFMNENPDFFQNLSG